MKLTGTIRGQHAKLVAAWSVEATGKVDTRGRAEYVWAMTALDADRTPTTRNGIIHHDPHQGVASLTSRVMSAFHLRGIEEDADEYQSRKAVNND